MVYSNLTGTTAKEFAVGHGKDTERKVVTTAAGAQITNKDGTLVPVEVGAPQKTTDAMQKGTADNTYASKAQGEKADTALQKLAIGTVQKGDDAQVTASTSGTTSTLNFVLPKGDPGTSGVDGERGTKWFYGTDIATDVTEDAFVGDTFVFIEDAVTRASVSSRRGDLLVCTVAGAPGIAEWEYRMNIIGPSGSIWYFGTGITGTSTTGTIFDDSRVSDAYVNDKYLNTDTSNVYSCVTPGDPWTAEWIYIGSIKGEKGDTGEKGATGNAGAAAGFGTPTASASALTAGSTPTVTITPSGPNTAKIFDFKFGIPSGAKGDTGAQGATGAAAGFGTPTASVDTLGAGENATVSVSSSGANTAKIFNFKFGIPRGATGAQGATGNTGAAAGFGTPTASATQLAEGASPTVSVTSSGSNTAKVFNFEFGIPKGATGSQGATGNTGATGTRGSMWYSGTAITGTAAAGTIFSNSGITNALVNDKYLNTLTGNVYNCATPGAASVAKWIYIGSIKGAKGDTGSAGAKGDTGAAAGFGTPTATATTLDAGSDATVSVTSSGSNTAKVFNFTFGIPKGAQGLKGDTGSAGAKGDTGAQGPTGDAAGFGTPIASATPLAAGSAPTVRITPSGPNTAKIFNFTFGIPRGATGEKGATGNAGATGTRGSLWYSGTAITGTATAGTIFSGSGIASALTNDKYLNTSTGNVYNCTTAGAASVAKWQYIGSIKGAKGDTGSTGAKGDTGAQGPTGAAAGFGTPTASATKLAATANPTVTITPSGSNTAKVFAFSFGIPQGAQGATGPNAVSASTTTSGFTNGYVLYNNNGKVGAMVAGNIHIDAVTSAEEVDDLPE